MLTSNGQTENECKKIYKTRGWSTNDFYFPFLHTLWRYQHSTKIHTESSSFFLVHWKALQNITRILESCYTEYRTDCLDLRAVWSSLWIAQIWIEEVVLVLQVFNVKINRMLFKFNDWIFEALRNKCTEMFCLECTWMLDLLKVVQQWILVEGL